MNSRLGPTTKRPVPIFDRPSSTETTLSAAVLDVGTFAAPSSDESTIKTSDETTEEASVPPYATSEVPMMETSDETSGETYVETSTDAPSPTSEETSEETIKETSGETSEETSTEPSTDASVRPSATSVGSTTVIPIYRTTRKRRRTTTLPTINTTVKKRRRPILTLDPRMTTPISIESNAMAMLKKMAEAMEKRRLGLDNIYYS